MKSLRKLIPLVILFAASCEGGRFKSSAVSESTESAATGGDDQIPATPAETPDTPAPEETPAVTPTPTPDDGKIFKDCNGATDVPFVADLYQLPENTAQLPDFAALKAIKQICIRQLNIANHDFKEGFPGVEGLVEWFALSIKVKLTVPADGDYTFTVNSDDGSRMYINNELLINNDGLHSAKEVSGTKSLKAGTYDVRIDYYQGPRYHIALELFWLAPGATSRSYVPAAYLKRP